jgi:hypothetical protein
MRSAIMILLSIVKSICIVIMVLDWAMRTGMIQFQREGNRAGEHG